MSISDSFNNPAAPAARKLEIGDLIAPIRRGDVEGVRNILDAGVSANAANDQHSTVLILALKNSLKGRIPADERGKNLPEIVQLLIERGADVKAVNDKQETALHWAAENGYTEIARILLASGADINAQNSEGETPLIIAARNRHAETLTFLLESGARRDLADITHRTAEDWVQRNKDVKEAFDSVVHKAVADSQQSLRAAAPRFRFKGSPAP